ncbi:MAG: twin-arginine translocase subunit TatC, partial [Gammaproteobacteria bacterium]|nr:twin-arginine translocase subunit TatC [Gammaproteobacteria bacterium]
SIGPEMVNISTDIGRYLDFVLALFFGFGLAFEVPIATIILVAIGFTTPDKLAEKRPFVIVGAFVVGMLLTPPDIISQVLLALPIWVLFEGGLVASRIIFRDRNFDEEDDVDEDLDSENSVGSDHQHLSDEEMEAELDQAEADEARIDKS